MNIALDVMGGDYAPQEIIAGAVDAARLYGVTISLVGQPDVIHAHLGRPFDSRFGSAHRACQPSHRDG